MLKGSFKHLILISLLGFFTGCGKSTEEIVADGIESANIHLSKRECQPAMDLLEGIGRQNKNSKYLKALSSAYACRAGYSTTVFFGSDIEKTASPAPIGGMTTYSTSLVDVDGPLTNDSVFRDLQTAIDILLYAGGISSTTEPSTTERGKYFTTAQLADIDSQIAFMVMVQLGKLLQYYSDASAAGVKAGGSGSNLCLTDYSTTVAAIQLGITAGGQTGSCNSVASPHAELAIGATDRRKRLCEGVVLMNNLLNVLPNVIASAGGGSLGDISGITEDIEEAKEDLEAIDPTFSPTATVLSQYNCENDTDITLTTLTSYYAIFFETLVL
jgi:hypothetical protein